MKKAPFNFLLLPQIGIGLLGALGLVLLVWPDVLLNIFPPLIGLVLVLAGAHGIAYYAATKDKQAQPGMKLLQSVVTLAVGLVFIVKNDVTSAFLAILFGVYVIALAIISAAAALQGKLRGRELAGALLQNGIYLIWGIMLLLAPFSGKQMWARFLGGYFILTAVSGLIRLRQVQKQLEERLAFMHGFKNKERPQAGNAQPEE